jgi:NAD(P)-dependent dehydrogenase (short-subunit alcohol dehydrogenase family)
MYDINGKVALITGANRGIGKAFVDVFLANGAAKVYAAVRTLETADPLVREHGDKVVPIHVDLAEPGTIQAAAETASDVQVVVNNAGVSGNAGPFLDNTFEALDFEININVKGLLHVARAFAPVLKANGGGALLQLNSVASVKAFADFATYCASKAASYSITQSLRDKLKEQGTYVLSVHPGPIDTDMARNAGFGEMAEPSTLVPETAIADMKAGKFHSFPDSMAKQIGGAYASFAENIVEANLMEG